jgi:O-antigen/teichoic acid export membrane protein
LREYLKRLAATGAAYTASSVMSKLIAVALLPLYTRHLTRADYGAAEVLLATVVALSIVVRLGIIEALLRFYYRFDGSEERARIVSGAFWFLAVSSSVGALAAAAAAGPLSEAVLDRRDVDLFLISVGGLWIFTNLELLMALFRLDERARDYFAASLANVLLTVALTVWLVVIADEGARGLLLGNFAGSMAILIVLLYVHRRRLRARPSPGQLREMLRFGLPTMPAELSLYALNFIDRIMLVRFVGLAEAGLYSLAVKFSQAVTVIVRAFNLAWPPLAYSIRDDAEARRAYALIVTYFMLLTAAVVLALSLEARWVARALAAPEFFESFKAVPLVSLGATLYALYLVLVVIVARVGRTAFNFPVAGAAALVNVGLNLALVPPYGLVGAGLALVGSYVVMVVLMLLVSRRLFPVPFEWGRLARIVSVAAGLYALGELALPTSGALGFLTRAALVALFLPLLYASGFFRTAELAALGSLPARLRGQASAEAAQDVEALRRRADLMEEMHEA